MENDPLDDSQVSVLRVRDLEYRTPSAHEGDGFGLSVPCFDLAVGEKVALVGPSGTGKSTFLNLVAGALPITSGSIQLLDHVIEGLSAGQMDAVRGTHLGLLFQSLNLLPFADAIANVRVAGTFAAAKRRRAAGSGTAANLLGALGLGQNDPALLKRPVRQLSVGQQQRVAAARALYGGPALILADEPTSALDHSNRNRFLDLLFKAMDHQRQALLLVTHDTQLAAKFDRVVTMDQLVDSKGEAS